MNKLLFDNFRGLLDQIFRQFYVWKYLQKSDNNSGYGARGFFWSPVHNALRDTFLLNLANLFDKDKGDKLLTIYKVLKELNNNKKREDLIKRIGSKKYKKPLKNLACWRNNYLAHKNLRFTMNPKELSEKFKLKYGEIEKILWLLVSITKRICRDFNDKNATNYDNYFFEQTNDGCKKDTEFVLKYGLHTEAYRKLKEKNG